MIGKKNMKDNLVKAHESDAGQDVKSSTRIVVPAHGRVVVPTGLKIQIPSGYVGLLWSRSGLSANHGIEVGAGCIDAGYRGEVKVVLYNHSDANYIVSAGDKVAQLLTIPVNTVPYVYSEELDSSDRGSSGFGSSGN